MPSEDAGKKEIPGLNLDNCPTKEQETSVVCSLLFPRTHTKAGVLKQHDSLLRASLFLWPLLCSGVCLPESQGTGELSLSPGKHDLGTLSCSTVSTSLSCEELV